MAVNTVRLRTVYVGASHVFEGERYRVAVTPSGAPGCCKIMVSGDFCFLAETEERNVFLYRRKGDLACFSQPGCINKQQMRPIKSSEKCTYVVPTKKPGPETGLFCAFWAVLKVRMEGIEPPRLAAPDPKSGASANSATSAIEEPQYTTQTA